MSSSNRDEQDKKKDEKTDIQKELDRRKDELGLPPETNLRHARRAQVLAKMQRGQGTTPKPSAVEDTGELNPTGMGMFTAAQRGLLDTGIVEPKAVTPTTEDVIHDTKPVFDPDKTPKRSSLKQSEKSPKKTVTFAVEDKDTPKVSVSGVFGKASKDEGITAKGLLSSGKGDKVKVPRPGGSGESTDK